MSKPKAFLKHANRGKKNKEQVGHNPFNLGTNSFSYTQALNDANDYLSAAVDDEDAMGKHRGGDAQKSIRFARKALDLYSQGLSRFPDDFDLAYNKARLELELATHPVLLRVLDVPVRVILEQSLASHRYALNLVDDNADLLFNTAQVLTAVAENVANEGSLSDETVVQYLQQALELQGRCLQFQATKLAESHKFQTDMLRQADDSEDDGGAMVDSTTTSAFEDQDEKGQWVSIIEPITTDSLIDTVLAQISTLTTLCSVMVTQIAEHGDSRPLVSPAWLEEYFNKLIEGDLQDLIKHSETAFQNRAAEVLVSKATFQASLLELAFRTKSIDLETYREQLDVAFHTINPDLAASGEFCMAHAKALMSMDSAVNEVMMNDPNRVDTTYANLRWNMLSKAQKMLTTCAGLEATKADGATLAMTHMIRGDISLCLHNLSYPPISFSQASQNKAQLLKNAEVFYRNASKLSLNLGGDSEPSHEVASFRSSLASALQNVDITINVESEVATSEIPQKLTHILRSASMGKDDAWRMGQLEDMINDGLIYGPLFAVS